MPRADVPSGKSDPGALPVVVGATLGAAVIGGLVEGIGVSTSWTLQLMAVADAEGAMAA